MTALQKEAEEGQQSTEATGNGSTHSKDCGSQEQETTGNVSKSSITCIICIYGKIQQDLKVQNNTLTVNNIIILNLDQLRT